MNNNSEETVSEEEESHALQLNIARMEISPLETITMTSQGTQTMRDMTLDNFEYFYNIHLQHTQHHPNPLLNEIIKTTKKLDQLKDLHADISRENEAAVAGEGVNSVDQIRSVCKITYCKKKIRRRNLCTLHYNATLECFVEGCNLKRKGRHYCSLHGENKKKNKKISLKYTFYFYKGWETYSLCSTKFFKIVFFSFFSLLTF